MARPKKAGPNLPHGFERCSECGQVRQLDEFRTPHANFGRCIYCWWRRWGMNQVALEAFGLEDRMAAPDPVPLSELGYRREDHRTFWICSKCMALHEPREPFETGQQCECGGKREQPRWPRRDFNERAHLCECCCSFVLGSGSKFSTWFCTDCRELVDAYNERWGRTVIPVGRHTFMLKGGLGAGSLQPSKGTRATAQRLWSMLDGLGGAIDLFIEHRRERMAELFRLCGFPKGVVQLDRYLGKVRRWERASFRAASFDLLSRRFTDRVLSP